MVGKKQVHHLHFIFTANHEKNKDRFRIICTNLYENQTGLLQRNLTYPNDCNAILDYHMSHMSDTSLSAFVNASLLSGFLNNNSFDFEVSRINQRCTGKCVVARSNGRDLVKVELISNLRIPQANRQQDLIAL